MISLSHGGVCTSLRTLWSPVAIIICGIITDALILSANMNMCASNAVETTKLSLSRRHGSADARIGLPGFPWLAVRASTADSITLTCAGNLGSAFPCNPHSTVTWIEAKHGSHLAIASAFPAKHKVYRVAFMRNQCLFPVIATSLQNSKLWGYPANPTKSWLTLIIVAA